MGTYIVIGGAGRSGMAIVDKLQSAGHDVYVVDINAEALAALNRGVKIEVKGVDQAKKLKVDSTHTVHFVLGNDVWPNLPLPDAVLVTTPNYGMDADVNKNGLKRALVLAERLANPANKLSKLQPIIELTNGYKHGDFVGPAIRGSINSPSTIKGSGDELTLNYLSDGKFKLVIGNDENKDLWGGNIAEVIEDLKAADIEVDHSKTQAQAMLLKLAETLPIGATALFGTKLKDAVDPSTPTSIVAEAMQRELHQFAQRQYRQDMFPELFDENIDTYLGKLRKLREQKGDTPGSVSMTLEANPPRRTEIDAIFKDFAALAKDAKTPYQVTEAVHTLLQDMEIRVHQGENIAEIRKDYAGIDSIDALKAKANMIRARKGQLGADGGVAFG